MQPSPSKQTSHGRDSGEITTTTSSSSRSSLSLGADTLRALVLDAARHDEEETLDLNGILWLEHLNLVVGSRTLAIYFYIDFLGLTPDASPSFHCNLGQQQLHLAETQTGEEEAAQKITGSIGLVVPSLETIRQRLAAAQTVLAGTQFAVLQDDDGDDDESSVTTSSMMTIQCPWGNIFHLYSAKADDELQPSMVIDSPQKMIKLHAPGGAYAASRMTIRGNPGIRYVEIACRPGTIPVIAQFYRQMMGCTVTVTTTSSSTLPPTGDATTNTNEEEKNNVATAAAVCVGPGVHLVFVENSQLTDNDLQQMQGVHLCIYTAPSFYNLYHKLSDAQLIWTNPRFIHLDRCDTWQQAAASRTLRFKHIVDLSTGETVLELEHETRPTRHGQFLKVPNYEPK